jgi:hypothetical protein
MVAVVAWRECTWCAGDSREQHSQHLLFAATGQIWLRELGT